MAQKFPNRLHKHQLRGPSLQSPAKANNRAELAAALTRARERVSLGGLGEPGVVGLLWTHPTHS